MTPGKPAQQKPVEALEGPGWYQGCGRLTAPDPYQQASTIRGEAQFQDRRRQRHHYSVPAVARQKNSSWMLSGSRRVIMAFRVYDGSLIPE